MPLVALEDGLPWTWESFGEYLDGLDGARRRERRLHGRSLRAAPLRARRRLRARVDARRSSRRSARCSTARWPRAGSGCRPSRSSTHVDGDGEPVPSRWASRGRGATRCARSSAQLRRHVARAHHAGLPRPLRRRRGGAAGADEPASRTARSTGTCSASRPTSPTRSSTSCARRARARDRWSRRGADHAGLRRQQHELPHVLRAVAAARLARRRSRSTCRERIRRLQDPEVRASLPRVRPASPLGMLARLRPLRDR